MTFGPLAQWHFGLFLLFLFFFFFLFFAAFRLLFFLFRSAFGFLDFEFAAEQFDDGEIGAIALAVAELDDPGVSAVPVGKTRCDRFEDFLRDGFPQKESLKLTPRVQTIALAERDHFLGERTNF